MNLIRRHADGPGVFLAAVLVGGLVVATLICEGVHIMRGFL
ncbi:hypothetical protein BH09PSE5_BH09PSE5_05320 [soil metagenome]